MDRIPDNRCPNDDKAGAASDHPSRPDTVKITEV
jgi:hypothetical protein